MKLQHSVGDEKALSILFPTMYNRLLNGNLNLFIPFSLALNNVEIYD